MKYLILPKPLIKLMMKKSGLIILILFSFVFASVNAQDQEEIYKPMDGPQYQESKKSERDTSKNYREDKKWKWEQFRVGGNFGLQFGNVTYIDISPTFGYYVIPQKLQIGVGTKFIYFRQRGGDYQDPNSGIIYQIPDYKNAIFGGGVFTNYTIWKGLFVHGEYEMVSKKPYNTIKYAGKDRINVSALLLGGGYSQPIGNAGNFYISALVDALNTEESIYTGTFGSFPLILRVGFGFGFGGKR